MAASNAGMSLVKKRKMKAKKAKFVNKAFFLTESTIEQLKLITSDIVKSIKNCNSVVKLFEIMEVRFGGRVE